MKETKKKLLITASTFPRWEEDTEPRFILDLAKALLPYAEVTVLVPAAPGAKDAQILEGVRVERYHYFPVHRLETLCYPGAIVSRIREKKGRALLVPFLMLALLHNLRKRDGRYDLVHANWFLPQGLLQSFCRTPYIVTGHGRDVMTMNTGLLRRFKKRTLRRAWGITAVSEPLLQILQDIYPVSRSAVISMGCDTARFGRRFRMEQYFQQKDRKVLLFVGRLVESKGTRYLIQAMQQLEHMQLVIVGTGPLRRELETQSLAAAKQLQERDCGIQFLGARTHEELPVIYASADLFVMPSVTEADGNKEGLGLVLLEAFASGLPVVATRVGGIPTLVKDGVNGCLAEEKDAASLAERINVVLGDKKLYNGCSANARETAAAYDYTEIGCRYAEFMQLVKPGEKEVEK